MKILYVGDVMGAAGRQVIARVLPNIKKEFTVDFVIVQAENVDDEGKGPSLENLKEMQNAGADFFTGGNHSLLGKGSEQVYENKTLPIIRPANLIDTEGDGFRIVQTSQGEILIASILGQTVGSRQPELDNPLEAIDQILNTLSNRQLSAAVVNFHGDFSSEKRVFGYYLDGRVSAVIGDHWHVPTADAMILPGGTAHITDVGMCGSLHSSLGVKTSVIVDRWKTGKSSKNEMEDSGPFQFNAVLIEIDELTSSARSIEHIQRIIE
jgi:2',3'-cyclic-nucleotide 2'-phosphodiesterase